MPSHPPIPQIETIFKRCRDCPLMKKAALPGFIAPIGLTVNISPEKIAYLAGLRGLMSPTQILVLVDSSPECVHPQFNKLKSERGLCFMALRGIEY